MFAWIHAGRAYGPACSLVVMGRYNGVMDGKPGKVIVAMSGGVDSSVAAGILLEAGWEVTGAFLCLGDAGAGAGDRGCCSPQDAADARRVAETLGIELYVLNLADEFDRIVEDFAAEYARGRTPNPCISCNATVKLARVLGRADSLGIGHVATGHHARIVRLGGRARVARGLARDKDQSYALFAVAPEVLERTIMPIGEMADKARIRSLAKALGLNVHDKPDSQDICFTGDGDYTRILRERAPAALEPGEIVSADGAVLGRHEGYGRFTIGQRRGLGVAAGTPMYVTGIDPATSRVTIGPREALLSRGLTAGRAVWHAPAAGEFEAVVQIRYNHRGAPGRVRVLDDDRFEVTFHEDVSAVTPGQAAVVYEGDVLLGGGWIDSAETTRGRGHD
jgi:tRNA-specific 2-thiouridylase